MSEVKLLHGDCLDLMQSIPDKSVDMILCDLPYGTTACKWDTIIPFVPLWEEYNRIIKDKSAIVLFCQQPFTSKLIVSNLDMFKYCWVWYKHYARGFLNAKKMPLRCTEDIAVFYKNQCLYNPQMQQGKMRNKGNLSAQQQGCYRDYKPVKSRNDLYYPQTLLDFVGCPQGKTLHPTQKPVPLLEYLIKTYTNEGETVLDNCMGSGSTGIACINTGRKFIGIELDKDYYEIAEQRIAAAEQGSAIAEQGASLKLSKSAEKNKSLF